MGGVKVNWGNKKRGIGNHNILFEENIFSRRIKKIVVINLTFTILYFFLSLSMTCFPDILHSSRCLFVAINRSPSQASISSKPDLLLSTCEKSRHTRLMQIYIFLYSFDRDLSWIHLDSSSGYVLSYSQNH